MGESVDDLHALWYSYCNSCAKDLDRLPKDVRQTSQTAGWTFEYLAEAFRDRDTNQLQIFLWPLLINATWTIRHKLDRFPKQADVELAILHNLRLEQSPGSPNEVMLSQNLAFYVAKRSARKGGAYELMVLLDKVGVNILKKDDMSQTTLFYAARYGNIECAAYLISRGAKANKKDSVGQTALFYAVLVEGQQAVVQSNPKATKKARTTADANKIDHKTNRLALIDLLLANKCDPNVADLRGHMALDYCCEPSIREHLQKRMPEFAAGKLPAKKPSEHLPPVLPPYLYMNQPTAATQEQYMICKTSTADAGQLSELENEFIGEHTALLGEVFPSAKDMNPPADKIAADTIGLDTTKAKRLETIRDVDCRGHPHYCTLKAISINFADNGLVNELLVKAKPEIIGYLALECYNYKDEFVQKAKEAFANGDARRQYRDRNHSFPRVSIRYLKVASTHKRHGVGTTLFCGMLQHLNKRGLEMCMHDMRINFYANNHAASCLYEKFGFVELTGSWNPIKLWPFSPDELQHGGTTENEQQQIAYAKDKRNFTRYLGWTGYRRLDLTSIATAGALTAAIEGGNAVVQDDAGDEQAESKEEPEREKSPGDQEVANKDAMQAESNEDEHAEAKDEEESEADAISEDTEAQATANIQAVERKLQAATARRIASDAKVVQAQAELKEAVTKETELKERLAEMQKAARDAIAPQKTSGKRPAPESQDAPRKRPAASV